MARELLQAGADFSDFREAADSLSDLKIGPRASRTSPQGDRRKVLDPRSLVANRIEEVVDYVIVSIRELTPERSGKARRSYNVRRGGAEVQSKGSFNLVFEIASDLPDEEQVVINVLEYGSIPHIIRPVDAKMLRFEVDARDFAADVPGREGSDHVRTFIKFDGERAIVFTEQVAHPGTRPHGMFRITADRVLPLARRIAEEINAAVGKSFERASPSKRS